jgi:hypothetical protein
MGDTGFQDRVAMRSRNQRSCEIIITLPANSSKRSLG